MSMAMYSDAVTLATLSMYKRIGIVYNMSGRDTTDTVTLL